MLIKLIISPLIIIALRLQASQVTSPNSRWICCGKSLPAKLVCQICLKQALYSPARTSRWREPAKSQNSHRSSADIQATLINVIISPLILFAPRLQTPQITSTNGCCIRDGKPLLDKLQCVNCLALPTRASRWCPNRKACHENKALKGPQALKIAQ